MEQNIGRRAKIASLLPGTRIWGELSQTQGWQSCQNKSRQARAPNYRHSFTEVLYTLYAPSSLPVLHNRDKLPVKFQYTRVFQTWHFVKNKNCNASTIPSRTYINHIQRNFFPRTSLEGQTTWSKMVKIDQNRRGGGGGSGIIVAWGLNSWY